MMQERLRIFLRLAIFWLVFMMIARIIFLLYNHDLTASLTTKEVFLSMTNGIRMDASISGYFLAASGLLLTVSSFTVRPWTMSALSFLTVVLVIFASAIITVDMELYRHWGFRMNTTPLMYIGSEAMGSVAPSVYIKVSITFIVLTTLSLWVFQKWITPKIKTLKAPAKALTTGLVLLLVTSLMFLPIRGSFTVAPMNTGFVYFHNTKAYANHSAVNVIWNFLYSLRKGKYADYPENFFDAEKTNRYFSQLYESSDTTSLRLIARRPNIILIILESFTADVIEPLGGLPDIAPYLNGLCKEGILFSNIYSSGDRTDKGLISILSGFPAQPQGSIIKLPAKTEKLPQLNRYIRNLGYKTSFLYGGDIDFANFRSYLNSSAFDHITTLDDFASELYTSKWGVHDQYMFEKAQHELDTTTEKFFKVILTLSSHEPFDVPLDPPFKVGKDEESLFINSCHYTDKSLEKFIEYCRKQSWWKNTLIVITADHGHRYPRNKELIQKERFHIPLLMVGGAVIKDTVVNTVGNQTDIANTLLGQLDSPSSQFIFSKDLLNKGAKSFAAYYFTNGYGFLLGDKFMVYDNEGKRFLKDENISEQEKEISKAYQQKLFTIYNHLDK